MGGDEVWEGLGLAYERACPWVYGNRGGGTEGRLGERSRLSWGLLAL